jgi:hypothetical protein
MQRAILKAFLSAIRTSACTTTAPPPPPSRDFASSWGSWLSLTRTRIYLIGCVEVQIARKGARRSNLYCVRGSRALSNLKRENCITSGSPLCRGLTKATYILCILRIEHQRLKRLNRESNPGPPALQANTLCKEPFERR